MRTENRRAFTIVELLVAAVLSMGIMYIIGVCFHKSIDTFRLLRSVGMMQNQLKSAQAVLKRDLAADHFSGNFVEGLSGPSVRDQRLDLAGWVPPDEGFFRIIQMAPSTNEGTDSDGLPSYYSTSHALHFSAYLRGNRDDQNFYAPAPSNLISLCSPDFSTATQAASRWAEVYYFLAPRGQNANGTPLYALYRREQLALPASLQSSVPSWTSALTTSYPTISANSSAVNTSADLTNPSNRLQVSAANISTGGTNYLGTGDDILITNVIGFEVKANWQAPINAALLPPADAGKTAGYAPGILGSSMNANTDGPYGEFPPISASWNKNVFTGATQPAQAVFDTWSKMLPTIDWNNPGSWAVGATMPPLRVRVNSLQIRIRIWDQNSQQARQVTIVSDI